MRVQEGVNQTTITSGSPLCGYAHGSMQHQSTSPDLIIDDKTVAFWLASLDSHVYFQDQILSVDEVLEIAGGNVSVYGHIVPTEEKEDEGEGENDHEGSFWGQQVGGREGGKGDVSMYVCGCTYGYLVHMYLSMYYLLFDLPLLFNPLNSPPRSHLPPPLPCPRRGTALRTYP